MTNELFTYTRDIPASCELLYAVFTEAHHIAAASSPAGGSFTSVVLDLRVGGRHHYSMRTADGQVTWGLREFTVIEPGRHLAFLQSFADSSGARVRPPMAPAFPLVLDSRLSFEDSSTPGVTRVTLTWAPHNATNEERAFFASVHAGMRGGWDATFGQIEAYVLSLR